MIAILSLHDEAFQPPSAEENYKAGNWVELTTQCPDWNGGKLTVDGTTIPLFVQPGLYPENWFDQKSWYSMNVQVSFKINSKFLLYFNQYFKACKLGP